MPKTDIEYEWVVEQVDDYGDIQECHQVKSYDQALSLNATYTSKDVVLTRNVWDVEDENLIDRGHAYVRDGIIEDRFSSGQKVPKKFLNEVRRIGILRM